MEIDDEKNRFIVELEFVQCLANPHYLTFLAQRGYFDSSPFVNYLKYLLYWKKAEYAKFLKYPQCLLFLDLLQYENFRKELVHPSCAKFIDEQQLLHWQYYTQKRRQVKSLSSDNNVH
ncbi:mediator of RNA polymerase II transcription subunit 31-A [Hydra vulgaris]|uniref:Mediator of RNA polymerase II transcription subunit 31 n=1 Tax=Hydra vulgaris TaxID=6087 RepID=T2M2V3_HYDVU|nr:mediator of RNA polymerase II transcription subunit 31-A-like [Hydra vulgaris]